MAGTVFAIVLFVFLFTGVLVSLAQTSPALASYITTPINTLNGGFPNFATALTQVGYNGFASCAWWDAKCAANNVAQATVYVGAVFLFVGQLFFTVLNDIGAGIFLIIGIGQVLNTSAYGIPYIGYFFYGLIAILIISIVMILARSLP